MGTKIKTLNSQKSSHKQLLFNFTALYINDDDGQRRRNTRTKHFEKRMRFFISRERRSCAQQEICVLLRAVRYPFYVVKTIPFCVRARLFCLKNEVKNKTYLFGFGCFFFQRQIRMFFKNRDSEKNQKQIEMFLTFIKFSNEKDVLLRAYRTCPSALGFAGVPESGT